MHLLLRTYALHIIKRQLSSSDRTSSSDEAFPRGPMEMIILQHLGSSESTRRLIISGRQARVDQEEARTPPKKNAPCVCLSVDVILVAGSLLK